MENVVHVNLLRMKIESELGESMSIERKLTDIRERLETLERGKTFF